MRPYRTFHDRTSQIGHYVGREGRVLTGSVPETDPGRLMRWFECYDYPKGLGVVHTTLSLPPDLHLSDADWHAITTRVLERSGTPPDLVPWFAWGEHVSNCEHVHIVAARQTWAGRPLEVRTSRRATDALAVDLAHRLGLREPHWSVTPDLVLISPVRKGARQPVTDFANDVNRAFDHHLPTTLAELNDALIAVDSWWSVAPSPTRPGLLVPRHGQTGEAFNPKAAGHAFKSAGLNARMRLALRLRIGRAAMALRQLARLISPTTIPTLKKDLAYAQTSTNRPEIGRGSSDLEDRRDARGYPQVVALAEPAGAGQSRPDDQLRRAAAGLHATDRRGLPEPGRSVPRPAHRGPRHQRKAQFPDRRFVSRGRWILRFISLARQHAIALRHRVDLASDSLLLRLDGEDPVRFSFSDRAFDPRSFSGSATNLRFADLARAQYGFALVPDSIASPDASEPSVEPVSEDAPGP